MQKRLVVGYDHGDEMSEWQETTLENAPLEIIDGDRGVNYPSQSEFTAQGYCLFLNAGNVTTTGFDFSNCAFITAERDSLLRKGKLSQNDVILTTRGTVGNTAYFDHSVPFRNIRINSGMVILRADTSLLYPRYLYIFVRSAIFLAQVLALRTGSAQPQLPIRDMKRIKIPLPPLPIQHAIAHILGSLDDKIELNRRMNETLEAMARALFKDWFVEFGPVRAKMEGRQPPGLSAEVAALFPDALDTEGKPVGWRKSQIGDEVTVVGGSTPSTKDLVFWNGGTHYWTTPKDLSSLSSPILLYTERQITDAGLSQISSGLLPVGTVLLSSRAPIGYMAIAEIPTAINQGFIAMKCNQSLPNLFVLFWCKERMDLILGNANGSTFQEISKSNFRPIPVIVPSQNILDVFLETATPLFRQIVENLKESRTLAALRDLLLPKLLSGELRVRDAEGVITGARG